MMVRSRVLGVGFVLGLCTVAALYVGSADAVDAKIVSIIRGGTGQSSQTAAFDALAPTTTQGDIIYHNGTDNVRLAKGAASKVLTMNAGATAPEWATAGGGISLTGSATATNFASFNTGTCTAPVTATVTGAILPASTNANAQPLCAVGQSSDNVGLASGGFFCHCWVTATDQISFSCCNLSGGAFDPNFEYYTFYVQNAP